MRHLFNCSNNYNIFLGRLELKCVMPARVIILIKLHRVSKLFFYPEFLRESSERGVTNEHKTSLFTVRLLEFCDFKKS